MSQQPNASIRPITLTHLATTQQFGPEIRLLVSNKLCRPRADNPSKIDNKCRETEPEGGEAETVIPSTTTLTVRRPKSRRLTPYVRTRTRARVHIRYEKLRQEGSIFGARGRTVVRVVKCGMLWRKSGRCVEHGKRDWCEHWRVITMLSSLRTQLVKTCTILAHASASNATLG